MIIGLLKTILILAVFYLLAKLLGKVLFPSASKNKFRQNNQSNYDRKKEGDVTIHHNKKDKKLFDKDSGEYVDYEDVEEDDKEK